MQITTKRFLLGMMTLSVALVLGAAPMLCGAYVGGNLRALGDQLVRPMRDDSAFDVSTESSYTSTTVSMRRPRAGRDLLRVVVRHGPVFFGLPKVAGMPAPRFGLGVIDVVEVRPGEDRIVLRHVVGFGGTARGVFRGRFGPMRVDGVTRTTRDLSSGTVDVERARATEFIEADDPMGSFSWQPAQSEFVLGLGSLRTFGMDARDLRLRVRTTGAARESGVTTFFVDVGTLVQFDEEILSGLEVKLTTVRGPRVDAHLEGHLDHIRRGESEFRRARFDVRVRAGSTDALWALPEAAQQDAQELMMAYWTGEFDTALSPDLLTYVRTFVASRPTLDAELHVERSPDSIADPSPLDLVFHARAADSIPARLTVGDLRRIASTELTVRSDSAGIVSLVADPEVLSQYLGCTFDMGSRELTPEEAGQLLDALVEAGVFVRRDGALEVTVGHDAEGKVVLSGKPFADPTLVAIREEVVAYVAPTLPIALSDYSWRTGTDAAAAATFVRDAASLRSCMRVDGAALPSGTAVAQLDVTATGEVTGVAVALDGTFGPSTELCFEAALGRLRFPTSSAAGRVTYRFRYGAGADEVALRDDARAAPWSDLDEP